MRTAEGLEPAEERKKNIRTIHRGDEDYPERLQILPDRPDKIYVLGELPGNRPSVAIVGARMCSHYGRIQAHAFGRALAEAGIQVISGMALGIDCYAQEGALDGGGKTFAVLGCGADICYPKSNFSTYTEIQKHGGILSEEEPGTLPLSYNFPKRNRIISALSDIVLVVEAREKSGSLITVDFALEQGKTVFALPGRVGDTLSDGCNHLIAQGAGIACSPQAILQEFGMGDFISETGNRQKEQKIKGLSPEAAKICRAIYCEQRTLDELLKLFSFGTQKTAAALLELQIADLVEEDAGHIYVKK